METEPVNVTPKASVGKYHWSTNKGDSAFFVDCQGMWRKQGELNRELGKDMSVHSSNIRELQDGMHDNETALDQVKMSLRILKAKLKLRNVLYGDTDSFMHQNPTEEKSEVGSEEPEVPPLEEIPEDKLARVRDYVCFLNATNTLLTDRQDEMSKVMQSLIQNQQTLQTQNLSLECALRGICLACLINLGVLLYVMAVVYSN